MVTADNVLLFRLLAVSLWSSLALSVVLSVWALVSRSWALLALAAGLSGTFTVFALFSVGPFTLLLTLVQAGAAAALALRLSRPRAIAVFLVAVIVWVVLVVLPLMPIWLQWEPV
jgi:hypothetical protein